MDADITGTQTTLLSNEGGKMAESFVNHPEKKQESRINQELLRSSESIQKEKGKQLKLRRKLREVPLLSNSCLPGAQPGMDFSIVDLGKNQSHQEVHSLSSWMGTFEKKTRSLLVILSHV